MNQNIRIVLRSVTDLMLVGVLLVLFGALILLARLLAGEPVTIDAVNAWSGAFILFGAGILCFRHGVILDRQERTVARWRGLWAPLHKPVARPLPAKCYVSISNSRIHDPTKKVEPLDGAFGTLVRVGNSLAVSLEAPGSASILLKEVQDYDGARRFAEEIAKFLNVELRDRFSNVEVVRAAGELDEPLRERLRRTGESPPLPAQLEGARAIFSHGGLGAPSTIELQPTGLNARSALKAALSAGSVPIVVMVGAAKIRDAQSLRFLILAAFLLGLVLAGRLLLRATTYREGILISPGEIVVSQHHSSGIQTTRLTSAEIEEVALITLRYPRSFHDSMRRVVIRSDRGSVELGTTLVNAEEVQWLRDVVIHVLSRRIAERS